MLIPITYINEHTLPQGKYFVEPNQGLIYSECRGTPGVYIPLTGFSDGRRGYLKVKLYTIAKKPLTLSIHRLVYTTVNRIRYDSIGEINHIDGNILNNANYNLELITGKENVRHSINNHLSESRTHQLTLADGIQMYGWLTQNYLKYKTLKEVSNILGYDPKVIRKLLNKTHTLSDEIEDYFTTNK